MCRIFSGIWTFSKKNRFEFLQPIAENNTHNLYCGFYTAYNYSKLEKDVNSKDSGVDTEVDCDDNEGNSNQGEINESKEMKKNKKRQGV